MNRSDLEAFLERDWDRVSRIDDDHWIDLKRRLGPAAGIRIAEELREQVRTMHPDWPDEEDRRADFEAHVRLSELLSRVGAR